MKYFLAIFFFLFTIPIFSQNNLIYNFNSGDQYLVTANIISDNKQEVEGEMQELTFDQNILYTLSFEKKKKLSYYDIQLNFSKITQLVGKNDYKKFFSSDSSDTDVSEIFKAILSKNLTFQLPEKGPIKRLYSTDELFPDSSETKQKSVFTETVENKVLENLPIKIVFPQKPIRTGESWASNDTINLGIFRYYNSVYTLDSVSGTEYYITEKKDFSSDKSNSFKLNGVYVNYDIKGKSVSKYISDKKTGIIKKGKTTQTGSGLTNIKYTENSDPAYSWTWTINNSIQISSKKLSDE